MSRDNRSKQAKRSINRSHGKGISIRQAIRNELVSNDDEFWKVKYHLADRLVADYKIEIGKANHMIEQEGRRLSVR